ncbi:MAG: hypothetical protein ILA02_02185 [Clostridia bacterium]|nr:hypothetical protein [Clostridia bacterium]
MSSKLYQKYISLKIQDDNTFYLFKSGIFYIFISNDARYLAPLLNLKLTNLNSSIKKCGFPVNSSQKYFQKIKELNLNVKIIDLSNMTFNTDLDKYLKYQQIFEIINTFIEINIDELSISKAFEVLYKLQNELKKYNI